jgi:hypothetical protein
LILFKSFPRNFRQILVVKANLDDFQLEPTKSGFIAEEIR